MPLSNAGGAPHVSTPDAGMDSTGGAGGRRGDGGAAGDMGGAPVHHSDAGTIGIDCRWAEAPAIVPKDERWVAFHGKTPKQSESEYGAYLVKATPAGFGAPHALSLVTARQAPGEWSADGRFFAYTALSTSDAPGATVVEVDAPGGPAATVVNATGGFDQWAPEGTLFTVRASGNTLWVKDAADLTAAHRALGLGRIIYYYLFWSPDGRYLVLESTTMDEAGLYFVDVTAPKLALTRVTTSSTSNPAWSPDGRYVAYGRFEGTSSKLYFVDMMDPSFAEHSLGGVLEDNGGLEYHIRWFDGRHIGWFEKGSTILHFADLGGTKPVEQTLGEPIEQWQISPGGRCMAYRGSCGGRSGVCVRPLPPSSSDTPQWVAEKGFNLLWSRDASALAVTPEYSAELWVARTDGKDDHLTYVPEGTMPGIVDEWAEWSSAVPPEWLEYANYGGSDVDQAIRFWNFATGETIDAATPGLSQTPGGFSPDGKYYVWFAREPNYPPSREPLLLRSVAPTTMGDVVELPGVQAYSTDVTFWDVAWQP